LAQAAGFQPTAHREDAEVKRVRHSGSAASLHAQRGFSIIEVLVAAIILSIGMLGLAGLQMRTLRNNQSALERGIAVVETHAIADALRGDRINATNGLWDIALADPAPAAGTFAETVVAGWRANLITELGPDATGAIDCNGSLCVITIQWDDSRGTDGNPTLNIQTSVQI
jgi:type IV pilus assembly protein PilV